MQLSETEPCSSVSTGTRWTRRAASCCPPNSALSSPTAASSPGGRSDASTSSLSRWDEEVEKLNRLPRTNGKVRAYTRSVFAGAKQEIPDKQGRIMLPERLRDFADLSREAVVVGVADRIEIWNEQSWEQLSSEADDVYSDIEEEFGIEGI